MAHQYKRRTYDEAIELAKAAFRSCIENNLSEKEIEEMKESCDITGGNPKSEEWYKRLGFEPEEKSFYEIELYKRSDKYPYIEKSYIKILVPRDRKVEECNFIWKPNVFKYNRAWFS